MSKPATPNATVSLIRKSKLVADDRLRGFLDKPESFDVDDLSPEQLLDRLVDDGLLTSFQAEQLRDGRYQGFVLGNYRILSRIGRGGMGQIFLAEHMGLGRRVAIKVLRKTADTAPLARERFVREALASAKLAHPNIIEVFDVNPDADPPYLVMEYVDGISLQAAVAKLGPFAPAEAAECGRQIALGLQHACDAGLVHRDIKPANILIDRRGVAKILDLGIVRIVGECLTELVKSEIILGTVEYLAPEQALSSQVDSRADVYSLGATLYFLLAGHPPFPDGDVRTKILKLAREEPEHLAKSAPGVPPGLAAIVHRMLAKNPDDRYQSPAEAAEALAPWATPTEFPEKLFGRPDSTIANEGSPTAALSSDALQPLPRPFAAPSHPETGTVEIANCMESTATQASQATSEITVRTQTIRRVPTDHDEPGDGDEASVIPGFVWAILAVVVAVATLWFVTR